MRYSLIIYFVAIIGSVLSIYEPEVGIKTRQAPTLQYNHQYSRVVNTPNDWSTPTTTESTRSPYPQNGRLEIANEKNEISDYEHGYECPPDYTGLLAYTRDCRKYLNCWKGETSIQNCAIQTLFNPQTKQCDYPSNVRCVNKSQEPRYSQRYIQTTPSVRIHSQYVRHLYPDDDGAEQSIKCDPNEPAGLYRHPTDCTKFLNCDTNGRTFIQQCGPGTAFNDAIKVCDWPKNSNCNGNDQTIDLNVDSSKHYPYYGEGSLDIRFEAGKTNRQNPIYRTTTASSIYNHLNEGDGVVSSTQNYYGYGSYNKRFEAREPNRQYEVYESPEETSTVPSNYNRLNKGEGAPNPSQNSYYGRGTYDNSFVDSTYPIYEKPGETSTISSVSEGEGDIPSQYPPTRPTNVLSLVQSSRQGSRYQNNDLEESLSILRGYTTGHTKSNQPLYYRERVTTTARPVNMTSNLYYYQPAIYHPIYFQHPTTTPPPPNIETDYLPINDALQMLLKPYNTNNKETNGNNLHSEAHTKVLESKLITMAGNKGRLSEKSYTVPYEQPSLAAADFEDHTTVAPHRSDDDTGAGGPLYPLYVTNDYPTHFHIPFNTINEQREEKVAVTTPPHRSGFEHSEYWHRQHGGPIMPSTNYKNDFEHTEDWHRQHDANIPSPNTRNEFEYSEDWDYQHGIPSMPSENHKTEFEHSEDWHRQHGVKMPSKNHNTEFEHSEYWHRQHRIPMPSNEHNDQTISETSYEEEIESIDSNSKSSDELYRVNNVPKPTPSPDYSNRESIEINSDEITGDRNIETIDESSSENPHPHHHHNCNGHHHRGHHRNTYHFHHHRRPHHHRWWMSRKQPSTTTPIPLESNTSPYTPIIPTPNYDSWDQSEPTTKPTFELDERYEQGLSEVVEVTPFVNPLPCQGQFDCENGVCIDYKRVCDGRSDCQNRTDELFCDHIHYSIRLSEANGLKNTGRIEVSVFGRWGYVCDALAEFTLSTANVVCRELGYEFGAAEIHAQSYYPPSVNLTSDDTPIYQMDRIQCDGTETSLRDCQFSGWGVASDLCDARTVVGVACKVPIMQCPLNYWLCASSNECIPTSYMCDSTRDCANGEDEDKKMCEAAIQYRLADGPNPSEGRVEVQYLSTWGTVCDDDFGPREANVLCRSLGFNGTSMVIDNKYGSGTGPIWLDQVSCAGNESQIHSCSHFNWGESNCNHTEDVSVKCTVDRQSTKLQPSGNIGVKTSVSRIESNPSDPSKPLLDGDGFDPIIYEMQRNSKALLATNALNECGRVLVEPDLSVDSSENSFRVVRSNQAIRGHHPWQVAIRVKSLSGKSAHWCGAVLISNLHILTAAHCLDGFRKGSYVIRLGDHNVDEIESSEIEVYIENWYIHDDFRQGHKMNNDLAVVTLKRPVQFSKYIQPICLPEPNTVYEPDTNCTISGWGSIKYGVSTPALELRAATVPILNDDDCKRREVYGRSLKGGMFCAGYLGGNTVDACDGDSGGPLVCPNSDGSNTLYGIISWGHRCGVANKPGVYVKVPHYVEWIYDKIQRSLNK